MSATTLAFKPAAALGPNTTSVQTALAQGTLGVGFSGTGFLILWMTGVTAVLKQLGIISERTRLAGASGGAITGARLCAGVSPLEASVQDFVSAVVCRQLDNCRGIQGQGLRNSLSGGLPAAVAERCRGRLFVAVTEARPGQQRDAALLVGPGWTAKQQVVDAVLASSWVPGNAGALTTDALKPYGVAAAYDGAFSNFLPAPPGATYTITVSTIAPEPGASQNVQMNMLLQVLTDTANVSSKAQAAYLPLNPVQVPVPKPDIFPGLAGPLRFTPAAWNAFSMVIPDSNCTLVYLYNTGRADAAAFVRKHGLAKPAALQAALAATAPRPDPKNAWWYTKCGADAGGAPAAAAPKPSAAPKPAGAPAAKPGATKP